MTNEQIERAIEWVEHRSQGESMPGVLDMYRICIVALCAARERIANPGAVSDGYHTFDELYHHRAVLFSVICNEHPDIAWKSKLHSDGTMYEGDFIVGINTPRGQALYHYDIDPYWDMFKVPEIPSAPEWDGYLPAHAIERIASIEPVAQIIFCKECEFYKPSNEHPEYVSCKRVFMMPQTAPDDFCSYGKRKEGTP